MVERPCLRKVNKHERGALRNKTHKSIGIYMLIMSSFPRIMKSPVIPWAGKSLFTHTGVRVRNYC